MFKERLKPTTKAEVIQRFVPSVLVSSDALSKMSMYVDECKDEIGWLGTAYRNEEENTITINDVYLFEQEVHATTTEITPEGLTDFAQELLLSGDDGMEVWNNLKVWGHSHVNMGVTPSGQDDHQMETFKEGGHDWFIRLIANKKGEMKIDMYDYKNNIVLLDMPWSELPSGEEWVVLEQINKLYEELELYKQEREKTYKASIEVEMKRKVKKKRYVTPAHRSWAGVGTANNGVSRGWSRGTGSNKYLAYHEYLDDELSYGSLYGAGISLSQAMTSDIEVYDYLSTQDLMDLAHCRDTDELEDELADFGYSGYFTIEDLKRILRVVTQYLEEA